MALDILLPFMVIIAVATYVQTVAGFALGMIVMGAVTTFNLVPIAFTSVVIGAVTLINSVTVLKGNIRAVEKGLVAKTALGIVPGLILGLWLLDYMSASLSEQLKLLLGGTIIAAGLIIALKPAPLSQPSAAPAFTAAGVASGILAGLFSMGGPPLVYLYYRQPLDLAAIRLCLLSIFLVSSIGRLSLVGIQGGLTLDMLLYSLLCIPVVTFATWVGKRYPPPLSPLSMRRVAFGLLIVIGSSLILL